MSVLEAKEKVRETYYMCCWCGEKFPDSKAYVEHYRIKARAGDYKHDNWVRLFKDQKEGVVSANL